jgi:hypothetical protein
MESRVLPAFLQAGQVKIAEFCLDVRVSRGSFPLSVSIQEIREAVRPVKEDFESGSVEAIGFGGGEISLASTGEERLVPFSRGLVEEIPRARQAHQGPSQSIQKMIKDGGGCIG